MIRADAKREIPSAEASGGGDGESGKKLEELRKTCNGIEDQLTRDWLVHSIDLFNSFYKSLPDLHRLLQGEMLLANQAPQNATNKWNFIKSEAFRNLPDFMLQQYDSMQVSSFMGIFPEINRVWMTIDNHLYLWNYDGQVVGELINSHEDPDQIIVNVALVKPIAGVFLEQIEYLLVISTPLEIYFMGVAFAEKKKKNCSRGALTMYKTDMSCHADNVNMSSIIGTSKGRIFMRGNDGQLFELLYQAQDGWVTRKVRKVNMSGSALSVFIPSIFNWAGNDPIKMITLDDERNILYTISKNNNIELISLGENGMEFTKIARISDLSDQLSRFNSFDDAIISMHPLSMSESSYLHCVAIGASGSRLYFTTARHPQQYSTIASKYTPPSVLELRYVLSPAGQTLGTQGPKVHEAFYSFGISIASQALEEVDRVMMFAPHTGLITQYQQKAMIEYASFFDIEGRTWAIAEAASPFLTAFKDQGNSTLGISLNELVTQFEYPARKFYLLTNGGLTTISKLRPIDILLKLISDSGTGDARPFQEFFSSFGQDEACAMSLAIACSHSSISTNQAVIPQNTVSFASRLYFELGGMPVMRASIAQTPGNKSLGVPISSTELFHSAKHNGLVVYTSRLLKNVWNQGIVVSRKNSDGTVEIVDSNLKIDSLISVQTNLQALDRFLKQYPKFTAPPTPDTRPPQGDHEAWKIEQQSFANIHELILRSIEAIAFLSILIDFRISQVSKSLTAQERMDLSGMTFELLVVSNKGKQVAKTLMTALVNSQINKELGVEGIISSLQQRCPSICESSDVILYKGMEHLRSAKSFSGQGTTGQDLHEALRLFCSVTKFISVEKLREIVECFNSLRYYSGIVDLCLLKAAEFRYSAANDQMVNSNQVDEMQLRHECYKLIFEALDSIASLNEPSARAKDEKNRLEQSTLSHALLSDDVEFHYALYSWFIERGRIETLLEIQSGFLEEYLCSRSSGNLQTADYLCRFYVRNNRFFDAASLFHAVAYYQGLSLGERLGYLTNAITHARSSSGADTQEILNLLQDEVDLARVQLDLSSTLASTPQVDDDDINLVNDELFDANQLFFLAKKYDLHEITLKVLFVSDRGGEGKFTTLVEHLWTQIIEGIVQNSPNPLESLCEKIKTLGRSFYPDENIFPLKYLISKLENMSFEKSVGDGKSPWVVNICLDIQIPYSRIFSAYQDLYDSKLPPWSSPKSLSFLIQNLAFIIEKWFDHIRSPSVSLYERSEFPARTIDEVLSKYLVNVPHTSTSLLDRLHAVQSRVRSTF